MTRFDRKASRYTLAVFLAVRRSVFAQLTYAAPWGKQSISYGLARRCALFLVLWLGARYRGERSVRDGHRLFFLAARPFFRD